jgi:hypothetical protein
MRTKSWGYGPLVAQRKLLLCQALTSACGPRDHEAGVPRDRSLGQQAHRRVFEREGPQSANSCRALPWIEGARVQTMNIKTSGYGALVARCKRLLCQALTSASRKGSPNPFG